jgi:hypothetical protein
MGHFLQLFFAPIFATTEIGLMIIWALLRKTSLFSGNEHYRRSRLD